MSDHTVRFFFSGGCRRWPLNAANRRRKSQWRPLAFFLLALVLAGPRSAGADEPVASAYGLIRASGVGGGLCVFVGLDDGEQVTRACDQGEFVVHCLHPDGRIVDRMRQTLQSNHRYGQVSVDRWSGGALPYTENLVNLLVADGLPMVGEDGFSAEELVRVLCPNGVAYLGAREPAKAADLVARATAAGMDRVEVVGGESRWVRMVKPRPKEIDEWTHWLHGADGNAVAEDTVVGPPRRAQWVAEPRWQRHHETTPSLEAMVSSRGRLFAIINEAPAGVDGLPDRWNLVARDAFNGKLLWKRPIDEWGWKYWGDHSHGNGRWNHPTHISRRVVAIGDRVYATLGFNAPLTALDGATGQTVMTYPETEFTDEILYEDGTLVLSLNTAPQGPGRIDEKPPVEKAVTAIDAETGEVFWRTEGFEGAASKADAIERVTHLTMVAGGDKVFLVEENALVALDLRTGKRLWRKDRPPREKPVTYGSYYFTNLFSLLYHDGVVLFTEPDPTVKRLPWDVPAHADLMGLSAETGEVLWTRDCGIWGHYNPGDLFIIDGRLWIHDDEEFLMHAVDPKTGKTQRSVSTEEALVQGHHHRCYRNKATTNYVLTGRRGVEFIDLQSEENLRHHWVRGTCRYGILPCNGLLYAPPHPCVCYITAKLNGFWALAPERADHAQGKTGGGTPFQKGPAYGAALSDSSNADSENWPTYRHDAARSGSATTAVEPELEMAWETTIGGRVTSPVIAEEKVFVASSNKHIVWALSADGGKPLWKYTAGARVDTPPTVYRGLVLFGSADGWVYCLRAGDGKLVWRRRGAPQERRMMNRGQLESTWPIHGNILVQNGTAYFAAGRSSFLDGGILVYAVDPATGDVLQKRRIDSIDPKTGDMVESLMRYDMPPEALGALPDVLVGNGTHVYMRHLKFAPDSLKYRSAVEDLPEKRGKREHQSVGAHLMSVAGLLDDSWFNQTYWSVDGRSQSKLLVFDEETACGVKPFPGTARHSRAIFVPGRKGYTLFANDRPKHAKRWSVKIPVRARAMVLAGETLFLAGPPDLVPEDDPYAAFEGKLGAKLWAVSATDGERLAEYELASPPVFDGVAAARKRLYLSTENGTVLCYGKQ
ncbi:MAG: PQQ-binding-like beta-propeller repeat protein [Pirellulaceae bacterium]